LATAACQSIGALARAIGVLKWRSLEVIQILGIIKTSSNHMLSEILPCMEGCLAEKTIQQGITSEVGTFLLFA